MEQGLTAGLPQMFDTHFHQLGIKLLSNNGPTALGLWEDEKFIGLDSLEKPVGGNIQSVLSMVDGLFPRECAATLRWQGLLTVRSQKAKAILMERNRFIRGVPDSTGEQKWGLYALWLGEGADAWSGPRSVSLVDAIAAIKDSGGTFDRRLVVPGVIRGNVCFIERGHGDRIIRSTKYSPQELIGKLSGGKGSDSHAKPVMLDFQEIQGLVSWVGAVKLFAERRNPELVTTGQPSYTTSSSRQY